MPPAKAPEMVHFQDPSGKHRADGIGAKHAKEEDGDALGKLALGVPSRESVYRAGDVPGLAEPQHDARCEKACAVAEKDLERGNGAKY